MKWVSAISTSVSLETAIEEVAKQIKTQLGIQPDLALVFVSVAFASEYARLLPLLEARLPGAHIVGCSGSGVIGMEADGFPLEIEEGPALSITAACLPNVHITSFHFTAADLPDLDRPPEAWSILIGVAPSANPSFVILADPFSSGTRELLQGMDYAYPEATKVGGLSGVDSFSRHSGLFCKGELHREGMIGIALSGEIVMEAIVAQGCRPIGDLYRVSEGDRNIMLKLEPDSVEGRPAADADTAQTPLEILQNIFQSMDEEERELAQNALFIGVAQSGFKPSLTRRDFLIRNLVGVDPRNGAIAVADKIRPGMRIQFHRRDAQTSEEDLEALLRRYRVES